MSVQAQQQLDPAAVQELTAAATQTDGVAPLSEATWLAIRRPGPQDHWWTVTEDDRLRGFGFLTTEPDQNTWGELVVHPDARRQGIGTQLVEAMTGSVNDAGRLRLWAHGDLPAARSLAEELGWTPVRDLWRMERQVAAEPEIVAPQPPDGFRIRAFRPGADDAAWLGVNARAFAHHPEQGALEQADLDDRKSQPWFDPAGLLLIEDVRGDRPVLAASHWTKIADPDDGAGEVYVVAVDPDYQGNGLGGIVTAAGLAHLKERGVRTIDLYVEGDNEAAVATYRRWGFQRAAQDVMYAPEAD